VKKYADNVKKDHAFRPFVDTIIKKCPVQYNDLLAGEGTLDLSYDKVVALHSRIINANIAYSRARCIYEEFLKEVYVLEDKINSTSSPEKKMRWSFHARKYHTTFWQTMYTLEWYYFTYLEAKMWIVASLLSVLLSISVVWSESLFWVTQIFPSVKLSIFYWLLNGNENITVIYQWIVMFIPVWYITYCAYWSMFQLRLFNYYRLIPHQQSDANSILFSAYYICRLTAPMVYNFLLMIDDKTSAFYKVMGEMDFVPIFGDKRAASAFLPLVLIILCAFNIFDVYSWLLGCFCFKRFRKFTYTEDFSDERIDKGRDIVLQEKSLKEKGLGLSIDQDYGSLLKKNKKKSIFGDALSFFKKKRSEDKVELLDLRRGREDV